MNVSIDHPTNKPNFSEVQVGPVTLWFSYRTVIGFRAGGSPVVRENDWGPTTGKHLNEIPGGNDKAARLDSASFTAALDAVLAGLG